MGCIWERKGIVADIPDGLDWWASHAQRPLIEPISDDLWCVLLSARDRRGKSYVARIDIDPSDNMAVRKIYEEPVMSPGPAGSYSADGIGITSFADFDGMRKYFTSGLRLHPDRTYSIEIGLAQANDSGDVLHIAQTPSFPSNTSEPTFNAIPAVIKTGGQYHMWFAHNVSWHCLDRAAPEARYEIWHAMSPDGLNWQVGDTAAIPRQSPNEAGLVRAWVLENLDGFEMWFCTRGRYDDEDPRARNYRLGYATSNDALTWSRCDELQTFVDPPKPGDWDEEMQCYPCVVRHKGDDYLFYCGNGYGVSGFGYAKRVRTEMRQTNG